MGPVEKSKGYIYVRQDGHPPVLVYARAFPTAIVVTIGFTADGSARSPDRADAVKAAVDGAAPGLYHARVTLDPGAPARPAPGGKRQRFHVARGKRAGTLLDELTALAARGRSIPGPRASRSNLIATRTARALADGLRLYVMPAATATPRNPPPVARRPA